MNNVSTPTTPAVPHRGHHEDDVDESAVSEAGNDDGHSTTTQNPSLSKAAKEGLKKKLQFVIHLSISLDTLVYAELCALYYMDCSFFRLMIRWLSQSMFISPKADDSALVIPNFHISAMAGSNAFCILAHLLSSLPTAGEASRGYLHGGILFDFIGQKAPTSRFSLLLLDFLILGLQCFMLTVNMEKDRIRNVVHPKRLTTNAGGTAPIPTTTTTAAAATTTTGQDHDAEERGVFRDAPIVDYSHDIEMQLLGYEEDSPSQPSTEERTCTSQGSPVDLESLTDVLRSGNAVLANFNVRQSLSTAWHNRGNSPETAAAYALQNVGYNATLAALAAQRRARMATTQPRES
ncbi:hypothetical protein M426DRAFT_7590 [Hypoxylon sp. CI-4A]|nr:hypothetical protein M426DRAFT_7590 [Hypoxylon sp. CI-4A]